MRPAAPPPVGRPARVHKNYWQQASKRGAAKELRFFGFLPADVGMSMWLLYNAIVYWEAYVACLMWF